MITEEDLKIFQENFYFTRMGPSLWRAYNRATCESASPVYNNKEAAIYYVIRELKQELNENIEKLLGGSDVTTSLDDGSTFRGGLHISEPRDGTEEI